MTPHNKGKTLVAGVRCAKCQQWIWSRHRHDFRYCECGETFVDGGRDYLRYGANTPPRVEQHYVSRDR